MKASLFFLATFAVFGVTVLLSLLVGETMFALEMALEGLIPLGMCFLAQQIEDKKDE